MRHIDFNYVIASNFIFIVGFRFYLQFYEKVKYLLFAMLAYQRNSGGWKEGVDCAGSILRASVCPKIDCILNGDNGSFSFSCCQTKSLHKQCTGFSASHFYCKRVGGRRSNFMNFVDDFGKLSKLQNNEVINGFLSTAAHKRNFKFSNKWLAGFRAVSGMH